MLQILTGLTTASESQKSIAWKKFKHFDFMSAIKNLLEKISNGACYDSPKHEIPSSFDCNIEFEEWDKAKSEHAALVAVAEAAESFKAVGQYWLNYPLGIPMSAWSVDDRTRYVTAEKMLNKSLANLAAVREGKAVQS